MFGFRKTREYYFTENLSTGEELNIEVVVVDGVAFLTTPCGYSAEVSSDAWVSSFDSILRRFVSKVEISKGLREANVVNFIQWKRENVSRVREVLRKHRENTKHWEYGVLIRGV